MCALEALCFRLLVKRSRVRVRFGSVGDDRVPADPLGVVGRLVQDLLCAATVNLGWVLACTTSHRSTPTQAGDNSWPPPPFSMGPVVGCSGNWVGTHPEKNEFHPVRALARGAGRKPLTHPLSGRKR